MRKNNRTILMKSFI